MDANGMAHIVCYRHSLNCFSDTEAHDDKHRHTNTDTRANIHIKSQSRLHCYTTHIFLILGVLSNTVCATNNVRCVWDKSREYASGDEPHDGHGFSPEPAPAVCGGNLVHRRHYHQLQSHHMPPRVHLVHRWMATNHDKSHVGDKQC